MKNPSCSVWSQGNDYSDSAQPCLERTARALDKVPLLVPQEHPRIYEPVFRKLQRLHCFPMCLQVIAYINVNHTLWWSRDQQSLQISSLMFAFMSTAMLEAGTIGSGETRPQMKQLSLNGNSMLLNWLSVQTQVCHSLHTVKWWEKRVSHAAPGHIGAETLLLNSGGESQRSASKVMLSSATKWCQLFTV